MSAAPGVRLAVAGRRLQWLVRALVLPTFAALFVTLVTRGPLGLVAVPREIEVTPGPFGPFRGLAVVALGLVKPTTYVVVLAYLHRLFGLYARGVVFSDQNSAVICRAGYSLMAVDAASMLVSAATGPLLTVLGVTPPFFGIDLQSSMFIVGLFVVLIGRIMDIARELHESDQLTI